MSNSRVFKKGELIFKEGDKSGVLYLIEKGAVQVYLQRPKTKVELYKLGPMQILAEQVLLGSPTHSSSAVAVMETTVMEFNGEAVKTQIAGLNQVMKLLIKSTMDKLKATGAELRSMKLERDNTPCPQEQTAKIFGSLYHTILHKGEKKADRTTVTWQSFKQYAQRVFLESPKRLELAVNILVKMKLASYEMAKNPEQPDEPEQIMYAHFFDTAAIENFFEFYQYYYFKGGKLDLLKVDETCGRTVTQLLDVVKNMSPDNKGVVSVPFNTVIEKFKTDFHMNLNNDHFAMLEQKGLFARRQSRDEGVVLSFDMREWQIALMNWRILREIDKWNEKATVDILEQEESFLKKFVENTGPTCSECQTPYIVAAKFCSNCGHKFIEKAA